MKTLVFFLQVADSTSKSDKTPGLLDNPILPMMLLMFVVMYFFMFRPQQKKQKELRQMRENLQKGDKIVTAGGIYGTIVELKDRHALVEVDKDVKLRIDKSTILKDISDAPPAK